MKELVSTQAEERDQRKARVAAQRADLSGQEKPFESLLKDMDRGLFVTEVMGQGVSIVTGDYSRGASAFWVENGEISYPVEEVTIAANLKDMFAGFQGLGDDRDERSNIQTGSILVGEMTIAGS